MKDFFLYLLFDLFVMVCFCLEGLSFGFFFYYLGVLLKNIYIKRFGFTLVAYSDAPFCGTHAKWLKRNCCLNCNCSTCRNWTCHEKHKKE